MKYIQIIIFLSLVFNNLFAKNITLNKDDLAELKNNSYVIKRDLENKTGFISFDVEKNITAIMNEIVNLEKYPNKIDDVSQVNIYSQTPYTIKAEIFIDNFFISFSNNVIHYIDYDSFFIKWNLDEDYNKQNYFKAMNGYWKLKKIDSNTTRIFYSNNLEFKSWIPSFIEDYLFEKGLFESTYWLKELNE
jgi:ribosome-associated toxin RatA of RatAB toxin-antitoxin module